MSPAGPQLREQSLSFLCSKPCHSFHRAFISLKCPAGPGAVCTPLPLPEVSSLRFPLRLRPAGLCSTHPLLPTSLKDVICPFPAPLQSWPSSPSSAFCPVASVTLDLQYNLLATAFITRGASLLALECELVRTRTFSQMRMPLFPFPLSLQPIHQQVCGF